MTKEYTGRCRICNFGFFSLKTSANNLKNQEKICRLKKYMEAGKRLPKLKFFEILDLFPHLNHHVFKKQKSAIV